jgi:thiol-disulfide isomerase/thioredoxin
MKPLQIISLAVAGAVLGAVVGAGWQYWQQQQPHDQQAAAVGLHETLPDFSYPDLAGQQRRASEWADKVVVLNFWATWCPPCREETPLFVELQERYRDAGVQFVGIAIDDQAPTEEFAASYGINYPILMGDMQAVTLSKRLGNRFEGLPFTVVADRDGRIEVRRSGEIKREQLEPLLQQLTRPRG